MDGSQGQGPTADPRDPASAASALLQGLLDGVCRSSALPLACDLAKRYLKEGPCSEALVGSIGHLAALPEMKELGCEIRALRKRRRAASKLLDVIEQEAEAIEEQLRGKAAKQVALLQNATPMPSFSFGLCDDVAAVNAAREEALYEMASLEGPKRVVMEGDCPGKPPQLLLRSEYRERLREVQDQLAEREVQLRITQREAELLRQELLNLVADHPPASQPILRPSLSAVLASVPGAEFADGLRGRRMQVNYALLVRQQAFGAMKEVLCMWAQLVGTRRRQDATVKSGILALAADNRRTLLRCCFTPWRNLGYSRRKRLHKLQVKVAAHLVTRTRYAFVVLVMIKWYSATKAMRAEARTVAAAQAVRNADAYAREQAAEARAAVKRANEEALDDPELVALGKELRRLRQCGAGSHELAVAIDAGVGELKGRLLPRPEKQGSWLCCRRSRARRRPPEGADLSAEQDEDCEAAC